MLLAVPTDSPTRGRRFIFLLESGIVCSLFLVGRRNIFAAAFISTSEGPPLRTTPRTSKQSALRTRRDIFVAGVDLILT